MPTPLANRFLHYEEKPPEAAWQFIASALEQDQEKATLADKLLDYEAPPPPDAWMNIATELQNTQKSTRTAGKTLPLTVLRLSAAAAVIGIICLGGFYYLSKPAVNNRLVSLVTVKKNNGPKTHLPAQKNLIKESVPVRSLSIIGKAKAALSARRKRIFDEKESKVLRNAVVNNILFADTLLSIMVNTRLIRNEQGAVIQNLSLLNSDGDNKYIDITSPNGEQTKISSKFRNALVYLRDNNYLDNFQGSLDKSFLESLVWKIKFQSWRKKLLETSYVPSSYNYLDIFQLKELITKEQ